MNEYESEIYSDRGCGYDCTRSLQCPYPKCMADGYRPPSDVRRRNARRAKSLFHQGMTFPRIAELLGVSSRTVYRYVEEPRKATEAARRGQAVSELKKVK